MSIPMPDALSHQSGAVLRAAREANNLSLETIGQALRIKPAYLAALEADDWNALPSIAHGRGFRRSYANYLGVTPAAATAAAAPELSLPGLGTPQPPLPPLVRWGIIAVVVVALIYALLQLRPTPPAPIAPPPAALEKPKTTEIKKEPTPEISKPAAAEPAPVISSTPVVTAALVATPPALPAKPQPVAAKGEIIVVRAVAGAWVQVRSADGAVLFERVLQPGETYSAPRQSGLRLSTGNAGGIVLVKNGEAGAPLGSPTQVLRDYRLTPPAP